MVNENEGIHVCSDNADLKAIKDDDLCFVWVIGDEHKLLISKLFPEEIPKTSDEILNCVSSVTRSLEKQRKLLEEDGWTIMEEKA